MVKPTGWKPEHDPDWWPDISSEFEIDEWEEKVRRLARERLGVPPVTGSGQPRPAFITAPIWMVK